MLETLQAALAALTERCYHYFAKPNAEPSYIVWAEDGDNDLTANNVHGERSYTGTIDLYTKIESDPLLADIPQALEHHIISIPCSMRKRPDLSTMSGCLGWCNGQN